MLLNSRRHHKAFQPKAKTETSHDCTVHLLLLLLLLLSTGLTLLHGACCHLVLQLRGKRHAVGGVSKPVVSKVMPVNHRRDKQQHAAGTALTMQVAPASPDPLLIHKHISLMSPHPTIAALLTCKSLRPLPSSPDVPARAPGARGVNGVAMATRDLEGAPAGGEAVVAGEFQGLLVAAAASAMSMSSMLWLAALVLGLGGQGAACRGRVHKQPLGVLLCIHHSIARPGRRTCVLKQRRTLL